MAKILFTGASGKQHDDGAAGRARIDRIDDSTIIIDSLKKMGHEVHRRLVTWTDDLSSYDLAIVGIGSLGSPNYGNMFNALYAVGASKKVIIFHEDWKIEGTMKGLTSSLDNLEKMAEKKWSNGSYFYANADIADTEKLRDTMTRIIAGEYPVLTPGYTWGNKSIIANILNTDVNLVNHVDLSPYVLQPMLDAPFFTGRDSIPSNRKTKYMLATLTDNRPWVKKLKLDYEVDYYGCKAIKAPLLPNELAVFETMNNYWGVLCPVYPQAGSGWFRMRFMYSALNKNIMLMDQKDSDAVGTPHIERIENYSPNDLLEVATRQSNDILKHAVSIDEFDTHLNNIVTKYM